jgi:FkbM family methyltransferase
MRRILSRLLSKFGGASQALAPINRLSLRLDPKNVLASFFEVNRRSGGTWGLKNVVFEKDVELMRLFAKYGEHQNAQLLQDLAYFKFFAPPASGGYFVEVGVGDGIHLSNTYFFEKAFGWSGLLVEPNPEFHSSIRRNRLARLDTRAASNSEREAAGFVACSELSRLSDVRYRDQHWRAGEEISVAMTTLTRILEDSDAPSTIDFMSIDTEGSELDVLMGLDFGRYKFKFITVEHNFVTDKRNRIRGHMLSAGYRCVSTDASLWDDWFIPVRFD